MSHPLEETYRWFQLAVPNPTEDNVAVQLGVHFEEVREMLEQLDSTDPNASDLILRSAAIMEALSDYLKRIKPGILISNPVDFLDSVCDQLVTATGSAYMLGMDPVGGLEEVNKSNWSKFVNGEPQFDNDGKIQKGPDYHKPDLKPFV